MKRFHLTLSLASLALVACTTVGPDYEAPELELPAAHRADLAELDALFERGQADELELAIWWSAFDDPVLTELIERATRDNFDLRKALARIAEAEARLGVTEAAGGPRADLSADYLRSGISENTQFGLFPGQDREQDDYSAALSASWELDLWGRVKRSVEAAEAELGARVEGAWAVRVSLSGQVADAYLRLRELQRRSAIAAANVGVLERSVETAQVRFDAGLVQELDLLRARTEVMSARAVLPALERLAAAVVTELGLLTSVEPGMLDELLASGLDGADGGARIPTPNGRLGEQVPADLLRRRPDVRAAERALAAQTARVGVATAELYPRLSLAGSLGLQAASIDDLLKGGSILHRIGPNLTAPLFSGGGLRANIAAEDALVAEALLGYEASVLVALHEVDGAAIAIVLEAARLDALDRAAAEAEGSLERSRTLYREGLSTIDAVLDARRALFAIEDDRAQARSGLARAHVDLYRALGGGWPIDGGA